MQATRIGVHTWPVTFSHYCKGRYGASTAFKMHRIHKVVFAGSEAESPPLPSVILPRVDFEGFDISRGQTIHYHYLELPYEREANLPQSNKNEHP